MGLSIEEIEKKFESSTLDVTGKRRENFVEYKLNPPSFIVIFYYYIYYYQSIPTQQQFISLYYEVNREWVEDNVKTAHLEAFNGRLCRTYPSLIRDIHFYIFLKESNKFKRVIYKMKYDLTGKVDVFVESNRKNWYGLQLRVATKNSDIFYQKKPYRNVFNIPALKQVIDMPLNLDKAKSILTKKNELKVYGEKDVFWLSEIINEIESHAPSKIQIRGW